jgi:hypothetical protein
VVALVPLGVAVAAGVGVGNAAGHAAAPAPPKYHEPGTRQAEAQSTGHAESVQ